LLFIYSVLLASVSLVYTPVVRQGVLFYGAVSQGSFYNYGLSSNQSNFAAMLPVMVTAAG
jgi:hypothetical protein